MKPYFRARHPDGKVQYQAPLKRVRCKHKSGQRQCKRRTYLGSRCMQHSVMDLGLKVARSTIKHAGRGLFAAKGFDKGDIIDYYTGEVLDDVEFKRRYTGEFTGPYALEVGGGGTIDCATHRALAAMSNHKARGSNACLAEDETGSFLQATKSIKCGDEITCNYGKGYWENKHLEVDSCVWLK